MILLITEQGSHVGINNDRIVMETEDLKRSVPKELIENVAVFGNIQLSTQFIQHCLKRKIAVSFYSNTGEYFGKLVNTSNGNFKRLKHQMEAIEDEEFRKKFAEKIIENKINNQLTLLRRLNRRRNIVDKEIEEIGIIKRKITQKDNVDQMLGYEGAISKIYFRALSKILPEEFKFDKRTRQPPRDPFNSMISLGYTILLHEIIGQIESVGLSPYGGIIHGHRLNHPSLGSDMIEEYRAIIVDAFVMDLINSGSAKIEDFEITREGVFLEPKFLKEFLKKFQEKLASTHKYIDEIETPITYRKTLYHQTTKLVRAIENKNIEEYNPIRIR